MTTTEKVLIGGAVLALLVLESRNRALAAAPAESDAPGYSSPFPSFDLPSMPVRLSPAPIGAAPSEGMAGVCAIGFGGPCNAPGDPYASIGAPRVIGVLPAGSAGGALGGGTGTIVYASTPVPGTQIPVEREVQGGSPHNFINASEVY